MAAGRSVGQASRVARILRGRQSKLSPPPPAAAVGRRKRREGRGKKKVSSFSSFIDMEESRLDLSSVSFGLLFPLS